MAPRGGWRERALGRAAASVLGGIVAAAQGAPAPAQTLGVTGNQPIAITADSGIEWQQDARLYIARGHAIATRGTTELHGDTLTARYRPSKAAPASGDAGEGTEIYRIDADGNVTIQRDAQTVVGDHAVYDVDTAVVVVTGKALKLTTATDTVSARDSLEWYDQKQIAVARGDAVAVRNGKTLKANILTAYMIKGQPGETKPGETKPAAAPVPARAGKPPAAAAGEGAKIRRVDAQGHVLVTNGPDTGRGDYGVYNADSGIVTLVGNVVITRAKDVIRGQYGVMDLNNNVSRMMPSAGLPGTPGQRVQGLFQREEHAGPLPGTPASAGRAGGSGKGP